MKLRKISKLAALLIFSSALLFSSNIIAQNHQKPPMPPDGDPSEKIISELTTELSLSEEQQLKLTELFEDHFESMKEQHESNREEMESSREEFEEKVMNVLTEEQQEKYIEFMESHKPKRPEGPRQHR